MAPPPVPVEVHRHMVFGSHKKKLTKSYMKLNKVCVPLGLGEELRVFGRRSTWNVVGPSSIENRVFTFVATNHQERNPVEYYLCNDWQRFRTAYGLTTRDSIVFQISNPISHIMRIRIVRNG
ncbi:hypothetical protein PIB30_012760 [Stylosanthes scabra]|uniref:TF-B3 domain-containing protein n=1 Tax=Stylosanthes scabra TaxID=79078 RepID=A0ABU6S5Z9_9FABA|nr:hypothetical protein [Stylosanthes scabra]